jgi:17beta-estradiol 17-dehydrogenase / very-long-chain 3-oxoacyl-CoA reductase
VNNVGRSHEMPVYFAETTEEEMNAIINININGTLAITRIILPKMIEKYL